MDDRRFDDLSRRFAGSISRRTALKGAVIGLLGVRASGDTALAARAKCANKGCRNNPNDCAPGCVCCVYGNGNARCLPPGTCGGQEVAPCAAGQRFCRASGRCAECCANEDCDDGLACTVDTCVAGVCRHAPNDAVCDDGVGCTVDTCAPTHPGRDGRGCVSTPDDGLCPPTGTDCIRAVCTGTGCTTAIAAGAPCLDPDNRCITGGICDSGGFCEPRTFVDCSAFANACTDAFCDTNSGGCLTSTTNREGRSCDDGDACTGTGVCRSGQCQPGAPITCPPERPDCDGGGCVCRGNGLECPTSGSGVGCCDGQCVRGVCCTPTAQFCQVDEQCCSGSCITRDFNRECA